MHHFLASSSRTPTSFASAPVRFKAWGISRTAKRNACFRDRLYPSHEVVAQTYARISSAESPTRWYACLYPSNSSEYKSITFVEYPFSVASEITIVKIRWMFSKSTNPRHKMLKPFILNQRWAEDVSSFTHNESRDWRVPLQLIAYANILWINIRTLTKSGSNHQ